MPPRKKTTTKISWLGSASAAPKAVKLRPPVIEAMAAEQPIIKPRRGVLNMGINSLGMGIVHGTELSSATGRKATCRSAPPFGVGGRRSGRQAGQNQGY